MNIARIFFIGFCATAIASACATTSTSSGSNSNWLAVCTSDSDCSGGLECWCGVCTKACTAESDCSGLAGAKCDPESGTRVCGTSPEKNACVVTCDKDDECRAVGSNAKCSGGACLSGAVDGDGGESICKRTPNQATGRLLELLANADHNCSLDSDCHGGAGISCGNLCGFPHVSKVGWSAIEPELEKAEKDLCDPFFAAGCERPIYYGCSLGDPICVKGTCENSGGNLGPGVDAGTLTCEQRTQELGARVQAHASVADRSCAVDADCTMTGLDFRCYHACDSGPLSTAGAAALRSELSALETEFCGAFETAGCTSLVPPCPPPPPIRCFANICDYYTL